MDTMRSRDSSGAQAAMSPPMFYGGLFLITACTLMQQVLQTRILSVIAWYHLAFFAISMAMFGITAGAVLVYLRGPRFTAATLGYDLSIFSGAFALSTCVCLALQMTVVPIVALSVTAILSWTLLAILMAVPFFFSGIVVSLALTRSPFPIGRVYGVDLLGAAAGCLGSLLLLSLTDGPSGMLWTGVFGAAGSALFAASGVGGEPSQKPRWHAVVGGRVKLLASIALLAAINGLTSYGLQPVFSKGSFEGGATYIYRKWNTFSRVAVQDTKRGTPRMWGPSPMLDSNLDVPYRQMNIDGDAGTIAIRFDGDLRAVDFLHYDVTNLAYFLTGRQRAVIIGVGGGRDILAAALFGYRDITGVELNPVFVRLLTTERGYADFTNLDRLEGLRLVVDEGRSWFARSDQRFDVVQMSLIDTWAATGAGAFSLSENGLYTVQAWKIFLDHLSDRGVFTVSRWYSPNNPNETTRMLSLAVAALLERGVAKPRSHIFLAAQGGIATLLVAREPFSDVDLETLQAETDRLQHHVLISPTRHAGSRMLEDVMDSPDRASLDALANRYSLDVSPPTDDRPFFFNQVPLNKPLETLRIARDRMGAGAFGGGVIDGNLVASGTLLMLFVVSLTLVVTTIVVPLRSAVRDVGSTLALGGTAFFLLIGFGFMLTEIGLLQRTSVFLGHPVYSLSVLLFTLILSTGVGSLLSDRLPLNTKPRFACWALLTSGYIGVLPFVLETVVASYDASTMFMKGLLCVFVIAPAGLLMGFGFPTGMLLSSRLDNRPTPWFWGVNGAAGVLASILAIVCSIAFGISVTLRLGAVAYVLLIPAAFSLLRQAEAAGRRLPVAVPQT